VPKEIEKLKKIDYSKFAHIDLTMFNLTMFTNLQKIRTSKVSNKEVVLKADNKVFACMVLIAGLRSLNIREVFKHPLGPVPWALVNCDGTRRKTCKAVLARHLEEQAPPAESMKKHASLMELKAPLHKVNANHADMVFTNDLHTSFNCSRVDIVFDLYPKISTKQTE
jgi:hypothetical protein